VFAENHSQDFLSAINDPMMKLQATITQLFNKKILIYKNSKKDVYFNTSSNKKRMLTLPFGEDPLYVIASYLQSDDGIETLKFLEKKLESEK
jgi:hypothetical protein